MLIVSSSFAIPKCSPESKIRDLHPIYPVHKLVSPIYAAQSGVSKSRRPCLVTCYIHLPLAKHENTRVGKILIKLPCPSNVSFISAFRRHTHSLLSNLVSTSGAGSTKVQGSDVCCVCCADSWDAMTCMTRASYRGCVSVGCPLLLLSRP